MFQGETSQGLLCGFWLRMAHPQCLSEFDTKGELECRCVRHPWWVESDVESHPAM